MKRYVITLLFTSTMLVAAQAQKPVNLHAIEVIAEETGEEVFAEFQFLLDVRPYFGTSTVVFITYYRENEDAEWKQLTKYQNRAGEIIPFFTQHLGQYYAKIKCDCEDACFIDVFIDVEEEQPLRYKYHFPM